MFNFCFDFLYMYLNQPWAEGFLRICALEMIVIISRMVHYDIISTEIKRIVDKNDCDPHVFLQRTCMNN